MKKPNSSTHYSRCLAAIVVVLSFLISIFAAMGIENTDLLINVLLAVTGFFIQTTHHQT